MHVFSRTAATVGVASAILAILAGSALADPPSSTVPAHTDVVGVGSDTSQLVVDAIASDYNTTHTTPGTQLFSWDAVPAGNIVTKNGCASGARPNGSGAGIAALTTARPSGDTTDFCVDYARSSRGPNTGATPDAFVAYAQDGVTWSSTSTSAKPTHAPTALSIAELKAIYSCNASGIPHTPAYPASPVTWNEVGGTGTAAVVPVLPQTSSGTRAFFLTAIGVTSPGSCVSTTLPEENEGTDAIFSGTNSQDLVFPYSIAVYLAQTVHGHGAGTQGNQVLGSILNGTTVIPPTVNTGTPPVATINTALTPVKLTRSIYNVVRNDTTQASHIPAYLQGLFGNADTSGYFCGSAAQAEVVDYGFRQLGSACGTVSLGN